MDDRTLHAYLERLPAREAAQVKKRLGELRADCGCLVGSIFMLGVTTSWIVHALVVPVTGRSWQRTVATGFAVLIVSALIGKLMGLAVARIRLVLELRRLRIRVDGNGAQKIAT